MASNQNNKTKKILAIVIPVIVILLIVLAIVLVVVLSKKDNGNNDATICTEHVYHYEDKDDNQHIVTCENCDYRELKNHEYMNDQVAACKFCPHLRTIEYPSDLKTPSGVKLSADKTDLTAGETFTLTIEISSTRKDLIWSSVDITIGPLNDEGKKPSPAISPNFELVSLTTNLDEYIKNETIMDSTKSFFDGGDDVYTYEQGLRISFADLGASLPTTKKIVITAELKVKENASAVQSFGFGVASLKANTVGYFDEENKISIIDNFNQSTITQSFTAGTSSEQKNANCITVNTLLMSIKSKEN